MNTRSLCLEIGVLFFILLIGNNTYAQGLHFSQITATPVQVNPANTGNFDGTLRANGLLRNQWFSVPTDYLTFTGSLEYNFSKHCASCSPFSLGAVITHDNAGLSNLRLNQIDLSGAFRTSIFKKHLISFGVMAGLGQKSFEVDRLETTATITPDGFRTDYDDIYRNDNYWFFDLSAGVNIHFRDKANPRVGGDIGTAFLHVNRPNASFITKNQIRQPMQWNLYALGNLPVFSRVDFLGQVALFQLFNGQREILTGAGARLYLTLEPKPWKSLTLDLTANFRLDDAFIPMAAIGYRGWRVGFSYDINLSDFQIATNREGGPEFTVGYIFHRLAPARPFCVNQL